MYKKLFVPVDLQHLDALKKALSTAADLARHYQCQVHYVSVGASFPSQGYNPREFAAKLEAFAAEQAQTHALQATSHAIISLDPAAELDRALLKEIEQSGCDLVVMGSHRPGMAEYLFSSNAGYITSHAKITVMVVR